MGTRVSLIVEWGPMGSSTTCISCVIFVFVLASTTIVLCVAISCIGRGKVREPSQKLKNIMFVFSNEFEALGQSMIDEL